LLYDKYKQDYEKQLITWADFEIRDTIGKLGRTAFYRERKESAEMMRKAIDDKFKGSSYAECTNLQIVNVQYQDKIENSLINTQVSKQQGLTKKKQQQAAQTRSEVSVIESQANKNITQI